MKISRDRIEDTFLNEIVMRNVSIISAVCGLISIIILSVSHELTLLLLFEKTVKLVITLLTLWAFSRFHWDVMKGMMGGLLFCLMYQEGFLVLGQLWGETVDFDAYLIMGVQGSLYLAAQSMSFMMTIIITVNHFIIDYSRIGNFGNLIFNQISIIFKIILYISLIVINIFLNLPHQLQINAGFEYISDLAIVIMLICIESQLDSFKAIKHELLMEKMDKEGHHE